MNDNRSPDHESTMHDDDLIDVDSLKLGFKMHSIPPAIPACLETGIGCHRHNTVNSKNVNVIHKQLASNLKRSTVIS